MDSPSLPLRFEPERDGVLGFEVLRPLPSELRLESTEGGRFRLRAGERRLLWARTWRYGADVSLVAGVARESLHVLPPLRAAEARAQRRSWLPTLARRLVASPLSPLTEGLWELHLHRPRPRLERLLRPPPTSWTPSVVDPFGALEPVRRRDDCWASNGVWPLRSPPALDTARVKAWRKHARDGTLPPVVLWAVSGLGLHLILDGHARLAAARAEDVAPTFAVLRRVEDVGPWPAECADALAVYARHFDRQERLAGRVALGRRLTEAFKTWRIHRSDACTYRPMRAEWDREVGARLGPEECAALVADGF